MFWGKVQQVCAARVSECMRKCLPSMSRQASASDECLRVCMSVSCSSIESEGDQTVSYFERAPVGVTERGRLNIWDQILFSACHIMRQLHQAQTKHTEWTNTGHRLGSAMT